MSFAIKQAVRPCREIIRPVSPAVAVQLTGRQVAAELRIVELGNIAIQIADAKK
jgi:hypothetical protein